ncbi:flagellar type III secretion system pore protein FliP [Rhizobium sp. L1K21]|uniref:flagellar type III secretion system pore protein FliP n=1 Tax=Rhizobium sp. L1K21 TaxID=2954933 RepID=UPI002092E0A2|nr:flagellar type III secretion system pore protein FliP [Rhizobium sp. L1K21]MCO6187119.1 flagellar type III secretion system pore protein FliP [Rhizobium sp. L1K21]
MKRLSVFLGLIVLLMLPEIAAAQQLQNLFGDNIPNQGGSFAAWIVRIFGLLTVLSIAPGILIMVTSFPRIVIAFSILRSGMGLATTPPNMVLVSLALFMTFYIMSPTFDKAWQDGIRPLLDEEISEVDALPRIYAPFGEFMTANTRDSDMSLFLDIAAERNLPTTTADGNVDFRVLIPAFMISEIRRGFEIGFLIVLPFLVIDMIVATITMAMGMMMLPPTSVSLPFKILFFVLIDGWNLLVGSLVRSFT